MDNTQKTLTIELTPAVAEWLKDTVLGTVWLMCEELGAEREKYAAGSEDSPLPLAQSIGYSGEVLKAIYAAEAFAKKPEVKKDIDPGEGWRWMEVGEQLEDGDEYNDGLAWCPTLCKGQPVSHTHNRRYRRRVTEPTPAETPAEGTPKFIPGAGWRLLAAGETVQNGDYRNSNPFNPAGWVLCDISIGAKVTEEQIAHGTRYRRRVTEPVPVEKPAEVKKDVDPGEGWRWVEVGELLEFEDEYKLPSGTWAICTAGWLVTRDSEKQYRRRIGGWRLLEVGEEVRDGDQCGIAGGWRYVNDSIGTIVTHDDVAKSTFRRKRG